ncbi:hypothetical protein ACFLU6_03595 [Acidobacteriota bacterium]
MSAARQHRLAFSALLLLFVFVFTHCNQARNNADKNLPIVTSYTYHDQWGDLQNLLNRHRP